MHNTWLVCSARISSVQFGVYCSRTSEQNIMHCKSTWHEKYASLVKAPYFQHLECTTTMVLHGGNHEFTKCL